MAALHSYRLGSLLIVCWWLLPLAADSSVAQEVISAGRPTQEGRPPSKAGACCPQCSSRTGVVSRIKASRRAYKDYYWGNVPEFNERPFGSQMLAVRDMQIANGLAAQLALYEYDFVDPAVVKPGDAVSAARLTQRGEFQLRTIADKLQLVHSPVIVQPTGDRALDAARLDFVVARLQSLVPFPVLEESVVLGVPNLRPLDGVESLILYNNLLKQTSAGGGVLLESSDDTQVNPISVVPVSP